MSLSGAFGFSMQFKSPIFWTVFMGHGQYYSRDKDIQGNPVCLCSENVPIDFSGKGSQISAGRIAALMSLLRIMLNGQTQMS